MPTFADICSPNIRQPLGSPPSGSNRKFDKFMHHAQPRQYGFTLPELLIAVTVAAILASLAVPSFSTLLHDQRLSNETSQLMSMLNFARGEASRRRRTVSVCPSSNGTSCSGTQWENGYIVFVNKDNDSPAVVDVGEDVVRIVGRGADNITMRADSFSSSLSYESTAFSTASGTFTVCDARGATSARSILINALGRPRRGSDTNNDGIEEDRNGTALSC
jgi:type IV fimbrial biogenesis protein FimT